MSIKADKYGADDGKISPKDKLVNFGKGIISPITNMFKSPKNIAIGALSIAGISALTIATGGAIAPVLVTLGVAGGGIQLATSAVKAHNAATDDEARAAWQGFGAGTTAVVGSVAGAKVAAKTAGIANAQNMNPIQAALACIKNSPKAISNSFKTFASGEFLVNLGIKKQPKVNTEEPKSAPKAEETEQVIVDEKPKYTQEEIQAEAKARLEQEKEFNRRAEASQEAYKQSMKKIMPISLLKKARKLLKRFTKNKQQR